MAYSEKSEETRLLPFAISYQPYALIRCCWRGAERIIRGGDCFDNLGGNNYNKAVYWEMS
jgi:hypothetical protein